MTKPENEGSPRCSEGSENVEAWAPDEENVPREGAFAQPFEPSGGTGAVEVFGNPTPLTAGFQSSDRNHTPESITPIIDRLSFTCRINRWEVDSFFGWCNTSTAVGERYRAKTPGYHYAWTLGDGIRMEYGDKASGAGKTDRGYLRFDYNPQKHNLDAMPGLSRWLYDEWNVTRLDVAIDYPLDLSSGLIRHETLRRGATYTGSDGKLETVYLGSQKSNRFFRVYDKKRERQASGEEITSPHLWRVEVEHRCAGRDPLPENLFDGLRIGYLDASDLAWSTRHLLAHITTHPGALGDAPKATRKRYRELLDRHSTVVDPDPTDLYRKYRDSLRVDMYALMHRAKGGAVSVA